MEKLIDSPDQLAIIKDQIETLFTCLTTQSECLAKLLEIINYLVNDSCYSKNQAASDLGDIVHNYLFDFYRYEDIILKYGSQNDQG